MIGMRSSATRTALASTLLATLAVSAPALAGSEGRRNTAAVLGAITLHEAIKGHTKNAVITGVGTAIAYSKYRDNKRAEDRRDRYRRTRVVSRRYRHAR